MSFLDGLFNLLTVVLVEEIESKAIQYIHAHFYEGGYTKKVDIFCNYYLVNTGIKKYSQKLWNMHTINQHFVDEDIEINRTNNPCERFNRSMNDAFPIAHPNIVHFTKWPTNMSLCFITSNREKQVHLHMTQFQNHQFQQIIFLLF